MKVRGRFMYFEAILVALMTLNSVPFAGARPEHSSASERTQCKFQDNKDVIVEYRSIAMNGRRIFGGLVPYGKVWETGYKQTPTFVTSADLLVGGKEVAAGHYNLLTIPDPDKWTMVLQKPVGKDSVTGVDPATRIDLTVRRLPSPLENFTISFDQLRTGCVMNLRWEQTEASVLLAEKK